MKKLILTGTVLCGAFLLGANAQTIMTQNFETAAMPTGWHQQVAASDPTNQGWKFGINTTLQSSYFTLGSPHTNFACVNDDKYNNGGSLNKDTLYTSSVSFASYSHVVVSFDFYYYQDASETATLAVSTNGGTSWTTVKTLTGSSGADTWATQTVDLSAYAGDASVMLAFTYGDGGVWEYGLAIDNVNVFAPYNYDLAVQSQNLPYYVQTNSPHTVSGSIYNNGTSTVTSMNLKYTVNGGAAVTDALSSLSIPEFGSYNFTHNIAWTPTSSGIYTMKIWADNINGNADQNHVNDTLTTTFSVIDSVQIKMPLFEEFNQASCDPCAQATPNLDSVLYNSRNIGNAVRYHVSWPGQDFMNQVTNTPFVNPRVVFYGVSGVPDAKLDGSTDIYPGTMRTSDIAAEAAKGTPFKITLTSVYNTTSNTFNVSANIKSFAAVASGLKAQVVLTVDTMTYTLNQSTESIPQYVFPQVAEDMMPNSSGTTLAAFTAGQTQNVNVSWVKNHPWAANRSAYGYDSTNTHVTIFIQDNTTKYIYQSATCVTSVLLGIKENSSLSYLDVYPNPATNVATIAFGMKQSENVLINVFNMLGQKVMTDNEGVLGQGEHTVKLDASKLSNGIYYVNVITNNNSITKKIVISK